MNRTRLVFAIALIVASTVLLLREPTRGTAEIDGSVAINCAVLASAIDGDSNDAIDAGDTADACDGIDATDVAGLANALGDQDDSLEPSDFAAIDGPNVVVDGGDGTDDEILLFAFVDNDAVVTFDATTGIDISVHDDAGGFSADGDANPETCDAADDLDCDNTTVSDGDRVVVATGTDNDSSASDPGDLVDVDMFQADDTGNVQTQTIEVINDSSAVGLALTATPASIRCDGTEYSTVTAHAFDADGNDVPDGTPVGFSAADATESPQHATTVDGVASSIITPTSASAAGITVIVTSGVAQLSIRIDCEGVAIDCPDYDADGRVTGRDVAEVARGRSTQNPIYDVDGDGSVTVRDAVSTAHKIGVECPMSPPLR